MGGAFLTPGVPGHAYPMSTLARRLKSRGHDIVSIVNPDAVPFVRAAELPFVLYCEKELPAGSFREKRDQLSRLQGQEALEFTHRTIAEILQTVFNHLPRALRETGAQALVLDGVHPELGLVPMHLGMPYVHVSNSLHYDFSGHTPLFAFDWPHETTPEAFARNKEAVRSFLQLLERNRSIARTYAEQVGLDFDCNDPLAGISKFAWLTQTPKEFDFPSSHRPPQFRHTGPFHDGSRRSDPDCTSGRPTRRLAIGPFYRSRPQSSAGQVFTSQSNSGKSRTPNRVAQAFCLMYHPCRAEYDARVSDPGSSLGCDSGYQ